MSSDSAKVAFLFPGQGAQTVGMGATVCAQSAGCAGVCSIARRRCSDTTLYKLCTEGPAAELDSTVHSQPALFVASLAALEQLKQDAPELVSQLLGRGGSESGRIHGAGVCRRDGFRSRPARRARTRPRDAGRGRRHIERHGQRSRHGARASRNAVRRGAQRARRWKSLTCFARAILWSRAKRRPANGLPTLATAAGAMKVIPLAVAGAFHTSLMQSAVERLQKALADVPMKKPRIPVVSNVDARPHDDPERNPRAVDPAGLLASPLGRLDAIPARRSKESRSFTNSAPAACCAGC